jgi:cytochrome P450
VDFDPNSDQFFDDPYPTYVWLREHAPVYRNEEVGFYALSHYADVVAASLDPKTFISGRGVTLDQLLDPNFLNPGMILAMDPPDHDRIRRTVSRVFTPRAIAVLEPTVREVIVHLLDDIPASGTFDGVTDFAAHFPLEIISRMLGVPEAERAPLHTWVAGLLHRDEGQIMMGPENMQNGFEMLVYFLELIKERRQNPADDMITQLCQVGADGEVDPLTDDEIGTFVSLLAIAGSETVTKLVGGSFALFDRYPAFWEGIRADPALAATATDEVLRFWPPAQFQGRMTTRQVEVQGTTIPEGSPVLLLTASANRDPREFDRPDELLLDRPDHIALGFGYGLHSCLGAALARMETRIAYEELATRYDHFEVDFDSATRVQMPNVWGYSSVPLQAS